MILVTCGTNEQPFDRLVSAARSLDSERLVVQYGSSTVPHGPGEWLDFVSFEELSSLMQQASVVISHAGVGSIILARRCGVVPLVVPRRLRLDEAVDDHQLPVARRLHECGIVRLVEDETTLPEAVRTAVAGRRPPESAVALPGADALAADVRAAIDAVAVRRRRRMRLARLTVRRASR